MFCNDFTAISWGKRKLVRVSVGRTIATYAKRYRCTTCNKSWTSRKSASRKRFSRRLIVETVQSYIEGSGSIRTLARKLHTTHPTIHTWIIEHGTCMQTTRELASSLGLTRSNKWSGTLYLDGKWITTDMMLLLAVDAMTLDIVSCVLSGGETEQSYTALVTAVESCGYQIQAVISDGEPSIFALTKSKKQRERKGTRPYPRPGILPVSKKKARLEGVPHQWCVVHAYRTLKVRIGRCRKDQRLKLKSLAKKILFARNEHSAKNAFKALCKIVDFEESEEQLIVSFFSNHWSHLMTHHRTRINKRKIPRDTNAIENVISYINTRLKTMRKLKTRKTARAILKLIVMHYRFKPLESAKNKRRRGKAPLELAGGKIKEIGWLEDTQKPTA